MLFEAEGNLQHFVVFSRCRRNRFEKRESAIQVIGRDKGIIESFPIACVEWDIARNAISSGFAATDRDE